MKNRKGFTLVEIIVTIGILAILGVGMGISLNNVLKKQEIESNNKFIEKVKSSAELYVSNNTNLLNDLVYNNGYVLVNKKELINSGYIREDLIYPETGEEFKDLDLSVNGDYGNVRVYYSGDSEMIIEYPFVEPDMELYLNVVNYTVNYNASETGLCYKGLNTSSLGLTSVKDKGVLIKNLVAGKSIIAYMEDGSICTDDKLNTKNVGTYKIRYVYTVNGDDVKNNSETKSATRYIVIKPTKPSISSFTVTNNDQNNIYKVKIKGSATDVKGLKLSYCFSESNVINECNDWKELVNNSFEEIKDLNSDNIVTNIANKTQVILYLFVKNDFAEYSYKKLEEPYLLTSEVTFDLNTSSNVYSNFNKTDKLSTITCTVPSGTTVGEVLINKDCANNRYNKPVISQNGYYFGGWYSNGNKYYNDYKLIGNITLSAKWETDNQNPDCSINIIGSYMYADSYDNGGAGIAYETWITGDGSISEGDHEYQVTDFAGNSNKCGITIGAKEYEYTKYVTSRKYGTNKTACVMGCDDLLLYYGSELGMDVSTSGCTKLVNDNYICYVWELDRDNPVCPSNAPNPIEGTDYCYGGQY